MGNLFKKRKGFTLAEVLTTLLLIGVVAVITIPAMVTKIQDTVLAKQKTITQTKMVDGFNQMRVDGKLLETYASTEDFVKAMQGYFKIDQVCNNNNLSGCFSSTISYNNGANETVTKELSTLKKGSDIDSKNYNDHMNLVGMRFSDGVNMLITYKGNCTGPKEGDTQAGQDGIGGLAECFGYFIDVDAEKNSSTKDKDTISNMSFPEERYMLVNGTGIPTAMTYAECQAFTAEHPDLNSGGCSRNTDYWIGAVKACNDQGMHLPSKSELETIASELGCTSSGCPTPTVSPYKELWEENGDSFFLWSSVPNYSSYAYRYIFSAYYSNYLGNNRNNSSNRAVCIR